MPIKYQSLGGSGGGQTLTISTNPNIQVKLSNEMYSKTITANERGQAEFTNLKAGIYFLTVSLSDGNSMTKEIVVQNRIDENIGELKQLKNVATKQKLKLSDRTTYTIIGKNLSWHTPNTNSVTLMSDVASGASEWGTGRTDVDAYANLNKERYERLASYEKARIIEQTYTHKQGEGKAYFITPAKRDVDESEITSDADRIRNDINGQPANYWLRTMASSGMYYVSGSGTVGTAGAVSGNKSSVSTVDIYDDTWVSKGIDGCWRIVDTGESFEGKRAKDLPLNSKIKFSSGREFVLQAKNVSGHNQNTVTLMSEFIIENAKWSSGIEKVPYSSSDIRNKILQGYYSELSPLEKLRAVPYSTHGQFWLMAESEAGSLNLSVQTSRIKKWKNGNSGDWFTRDYRDSVGEQTQDGEPQDGIIKYKRDSFQDITKVWTGGKFADDELPEYTGVEISYSNAPEWIAESGSYMECGIVPFFDLDGNAKCEKGSDGYWRIVG